MFLRCAKRNKDGKIHRYWSVVENRRAGRKVVQRQVLYLGEINDSEREAWSRAISVFDEDLSEEQSLKLYPADRSVPGHAEAQGIRLRLDQMSLHRPRRWGDCWLALWLWDQLDLDMFWRPRLGISREGTDWLKVLKLLTVYRLLDPGSEWRLHRDWYDRCAVGDLLDADFAIAAKDTLYRCHDLLVEHKEELFSHLHDRWRDLFNVEYEILLYDLTSTYFESDPPFPAGDKRRFGYSRDKRSDCVQVVIALVVSTEGLPLAYEVMPGNTLDNQTLRLFVEKIHQRYGKAKRVWLMDRGIPTEETLEWLRASDPPVHYLVGTPKGRLSRHQAELAQQPWSQAREGVEVKLLPVSGEVYVLARSRDRVHKEHAMRNRRLRRYLRALRKLRLERKRPLSRDELLKAIGAAGKEAGRDARVVVLNLPEEGENVSPETFRYRVDRKKLRLLREQEGNYLLRTNQEEATPARLWEQYMQLVQIEEVFRTLKGDLGVRPIWHQLEHRIEAHIFLSFQAYCLQVTLRQRLKFLAPGLTPRAVLEKMERMQMVDVRFPTTDGRTLTLPRRTEPDNDQRLLLDQLKLKLPPQPKPRISAGTRELV